jgi:ABC-type ATPase involved in cell division
VLLADEPTGNLDEGTRDEIIALLEDPERRGLFSYACLELHERGIHAGSTPPVPHRSGTSW